jgi:hypothetical protein
LFFEQHKKTGCLWGLGDESKQRIAFWASNGLSNTRKTRFLVLYYIDLRSKKKTKKSKPFSYGMNQFEN